MLRGKDRDAYGTLMVDEEEEERERERGHTHTKLKFVHDAHKTQPKERKQRA